MKLSISREALAEEAVRVKEAEETAKAEQAVEEIKQEEIMARHESIAGIMCYNVHLVPRKLLALMQEGFKLIPDKKVHSVVFRKNAEWPGDDIGKFFTAPRSAVIDLTKCLNYAICGVEDEKNEFSFMALVWLQLLATPIHEVLHSVMEADEAGIELKTNEILRELAMRWDVETPILDGVDFLSNEVNSYMEAVANSDNAVDILQSEMAQAREIFRADGIEAMDDSVSIFDFRTWIRMKDDEYNDRNNPQWMKEVPEAVLDVPTAGPAPYVAPAINQGTVQQFAQPNLPQQPPVYAPPTGAGNPDFEPMTEYAVNEMMAPAPAQQVPAYQPPVQQTQPVYQPPVQQAQPAYQPPVQQAQAPALSPTQQPWYSPVQAPAITLDKQSQWAVQDAVFGRLFTHMVDKCGFLSNGEFDPNQSLNVQEGVPISDIHGAQELFLAMDCGTGPAKKYTRAVGIFTDPTNGAGSIKGWYKKAGATWSSSISYLLHINVGDGTAMKVQLKFQNPNTSSSTAPLAKQGVPIMWITRPGDQSKGIDRLWLYKVTYNADRQIQVEALRGQRG